MAGSVPMCGPPVMNEGLMGTPDWLATLRRLERLPPQHILPGHGPVAHDQELDVRSRPLAILRFPFGTDCAIYRETNSWSFLWHPLGAAGGWRGCPISV